MPLLSLYYRLTGRSRNFEAAFRKHIAPIADYYFSAVIPSRSAGLKECKSMDIIWLEYEADNQIIVKCREKGPLIGYLDQDAVDQMRAGPSWVAIYKQRTRSGAEIVLVRLKHHLS
jgi:hypothetical protein